MSTLLSDIEAFTSLHSMSDWAFGEAALNDRHFVRQLREGREHRRKTEARVRGYMAAYRPAPTEAAAA